MDRTPDRLERVLGAGTALLLALVLAAIVRGQPHWHTIAITVWVHLAAMVVVLALTPVLLWQRRGTRRHRLLGWIWASGMMVSAFDSLWVRGIRHGQFSPIHALSVLVLVATPWAVYAARRHNIMAHRQTIRSLVIGSLLIAGAFTFPFGRLLGRWLLGE